MLTLWDDINRDLYRPSSAVTPHTDLRETENEIVLTVEVPGIKKEGIDLQTHNGILTLVAESANRRKSYSLRIPNYVDQGSIAASLEDGVLTVKLPKSEAHKPRKILLS
jgi:HSP20 family protein